MSDVESRAKAMVTEKIESYRMGFEEALIAGAAEFGLKAHGGFLVRSDEGAYIVSSVETAWQGCRIGILLTLADALEGK